ncbi:MAG: tryptophan-rich sensory protein [Candidatus Pacebacteria bacterium]|jgi:tryptophan-rich sensory protein|nr:tryptophan-rich sensory protein [Candidatus Paceibacterota bacterium]
MKIGNISKRDLLGGGIFVAICEAAGALGAYFTTPEVATWYSTLVKPEIAPPNWVFGPVWVTLYALMGIAAWLVWKETNHDERAREPLMIFFTQLGLNILWSALFFYQHSPARAFSELVVLWLAVLLTIWLFKKVSRVAAYLLLPYLLWITFAGYLNFFIITLN